MITVTMLVVQLDRPGSRQVTEDEMTDNTPVSESRGAAAPGPHVHLGRVSMFSVRSDPRT